VEFQWVKGHQDTTCPYDRLSIPAKLNCEADREASSWHQRMEQHNLTVPTLSQTQTQLVIQQRSITSHLKRRVHHSITVPRLLSYLQQRFSWEENVLEEIDWVVYQSIIKKYKDQWTTVVKHLHAISPTGHLAHRNNQYLPHDCPACSEPNETNLHLLLCGAASRAKWRQDTTSKIIHFESDCVDPYLIDILHDGVSRFHRQLAQISDNRYPPRYANLIRQQNGIGWEHLYRAKWSMEWRKLQDCYARAAIEGGRNAISGSEWLLGLGRLMIQQWLQLWKLRNDERHGVDSYRHSQLREQTLHAELQDLYSFKNKVCPNDRRIFHTSVAEHLQLHPTLDALQEWISTYKTAIMASVDQASRLGVTNNFPINHYPTFNPIARASGQASLAAGLPAG